MDRKPALVIPRGISIRTDFKGGSRIQISFNYKGRQCREVLKDTVINKTAIDRAVGLRSEIRRKIADGTFDYHAYFPNSAPAKPTIKQLTVGALLKKQLAIYEKQAENGTLEASTLLGYSKAINNNLLPEFENLTLAQLTPAYLREWLSGLGVTAKTARNRLTPMRSMLDDAVNDELLEFNPLDRIALQKLLRQTAKKSQYLVDPYDKDEMAALLKHCRPDERSMVQFWAETGLRPGELIALSWSSVDWIHNTVRIEENEVTGMKDGKVTRVSKTPKTEAGKRDIDLSPLAISALTAQKAVTFLDGGRIWLNPMSGKPWDSDAQIRKTLWISLCKRAGVRYRNPYQLRHTFASTRLTDGTNPFWLATQMGHVDGEMIFKIYGKFIPQNYKKDFSKSKPEDVALNSGTGK